MNDKNTTLLMVEHLRKIYSCRFGGSQVEALKDVSLGVERGEFIAVMGESGSGKTTLLNLLAVLDRPTEGKILLAGKDITQIRDSNISRFRRENLGFVFQDFNLLDNFSLRDNIYLPLVLSNTPKEQMESRIEPLAAQLKISDILEKYPYEVSGGQKQRISIARVFLKNPPMIILDEATSALDNESEFAVAKSLARLSEGRTTLTIAHRLSSIKNADRILVLTEEGIVEEGNHGQLLEKRGIYYHFYTTANELK